MARRETRDWVLGTAWVYSWYDRIVDVAGAVGESERQENQKEKPAVWIMKIFHLAEPAYTVWAFHTFSKKSFE